MDTPSMHGYYIHKNYKSSYFVDFFKYEDTNYIEFDGYRFENPFDILFKKYNLLIDKNFIKGRNREKDYIDIKNYLEKINYL